MNPLRIQRWSLRTVLLIAVLATLLAGCQAGNGTGEIVIGSDSPTPTVFSTPTLEPAKPTPVSTPLPITTPTPDIVVSNATPTLVVPTSIPATATETWVTFGPDWCTQGCLTLAEWSTLIPDPLLRGAAAIAYNADPPAWRLMARIAVLRRTRILWAPLDPQTYGEYRGFDRVILVNSDLQGQASSAFLADIIGHEVTHAAQLQPWHSALDCYQGEAEAMSWGAYTYAHTRLGPENPTLTAWLNELLSAWEGNDLLLWVESIPDYQRECAAYS